MLQETDGGPDPHSRGDGCLVAEGIVTDVDLAPSIAEYETWIDRQAHRLQAEGKITHLHEGETYARGLMIDSIIPMTERCPKR